MALSLPEQQRSLDLEAHQDAAQLVMDVPGDAFALGFLGRFEVLKDSSASCSRELRSSASISLLWRDVRDNALPLDRAAIQRPAGWSAD